MMAGAATMHDALPLNGSWESRFPELLVCTRLTIALATPVAPAADAVAATLARAQSDARAQALVRAQLAFTPQEIGFFCIVGDAADAIAPGHDDATRYLTARACVRSGYAVALASVSDPALCRHLRILLDTDARRDDGGELEECDLLPWSDAPQLRSPDIGNPQLARAAPQHRILALQRLRRYVGRWRQAAPDCRSGSHPHPAAQWPCWIIAAKRVRSAQDARGDGYLRVRHRCVVRKRWHR
ncbi:hypothetical protein NB688_000633 [Xanthomonas sacchari]|uniref:Uncharacterized protein n=2 Tax=Xanthomonas sacchari TaxID=56458 RepID=A0ABT3DU46_9XANT|nr:hypothetical protein [Xanthomonas sacchari]MCW0418467.1 hypothetical protein [Xanthomonas sacchari]